MSKKVNVELGGVVVGMSRNVFEQNDPEFSKEDFDTVKNGPHILLPPLSEGNRYELKTLPSGRTAVIVVEGT